MYIHHVERWAGSVDLTFCFVLCTNANTDVLLVQLEMVVLSESGTASSTDLLRTVPSLERKLTHRDAQAFLKSLCRDKWLKEKVKLYTAGLCASDLSYSSILAKFHFLSCVSLVWCALSWPSFHSGVETLLT